MSASALDPLCFCPDDRGCGAVAWVAYERWHHGSPSPVLHYRVECFAGHDFYLAADLVVLMP